MSSEYLSSFATELFRGVGFVYIEFLLAVRTSPLLPSFLHSIDTFVGELTRRSAFVCISGAVHESVRRLGRDTPDIHPPRVRLCRAYTYLLLPRT